MLEVFLTEKQRQLREEVREFVKSVPKQLLIDMDDEKVQFPREFLEEAGKRNLLGLRCPIEYGGRGLKWVDEIVAIEGIGVLGMSLSCLYTVCSIVSDMLAQFGTEEQKERYLRPTLQGKLCCAEALTEPRGGSDFFGATTRAVRDGDDYILDGQKRFIVGAEGADYFVTYAVTNPGGGRNALSVFIVDREMGVETKYIYGLMGTRGGGAGRIVFRNARIPQKNMLWKKNHGWEVFYKMMIPERLPAGAMGGPRATLNIACRYANRRKAFGQTIRNFEGVNFRVAESIAKLDAVTALTYATAKTIDENLGSAGYQRRLVSEVKKLATETHWEVVNHAMQILGGIGYTRVFPVERALRDARLSMIWTGTNEMMNLIIQHEYFKELLSKNMEDRDLEFDVGMSREEAEAEKIYE
ncbi:MAG: acyl-CoA dehydrogenase family protein [Desulfobacteraceae bacterium]